MSCINKEEQDNSPNMEEDKPSQAEEEALGYNCLNPNVLGCNGLDQDFLVTNVHG